jgi:hypothetical protein
MYLSLVKTGTLYKTGDLLFNDQICAVCQNRYYNIKSKLVFFFLLRVMTQIDPLQHPCGPI